MEKELFQRINSRDKKAFNQMFDEYFNALCSFSYKYIGDQSATEDIVQDVFIAFWENNGEFDHINAAKAFLYTSARNKCLNFLKHQIVLQKHQQALIYELESEQFFTHHVIEEDAFNRLYSEIRQLPLASQKIMLLALKGLKNREIASELNISENTVKTQKKIAYTKLKYKLDPVMRAIVLTL